MALWFQTNNGGSNGATVTVGSGGSADGSIPYDAVSVGTGTTDAFDNTHVLSPGGMSLKFASGATSAAATASLSTSITSWASPMYLSACYYFTAIPSGGQVRILTLFGGATAIAGVNITTSGFLQCTLPVSSTVSTSSTPIPVNSMFRVELALLALSATVGQGEARLFNDPFASGTPDQIQTTAASGNTGTTTPSRAALGIGTGQTNVVAFWGTYLQVQDGAYPPPPRRAVRSQPIPKAAIVRAAYF